jgi:small subunit ribosomal protein S18
LATDPAQTAPSADAAATPAQAATPARKSRGRGRYVPRRKVCQFCAEKIDLIDYKDVVRLRRYISEHGKIEPRRKTGVCAKHQRRLAKAIKEARHLALLPFAAKHILMMGASWYQMQPFMPTPGPAPGSTTAPEAEAPAASPASPEAAETAPSGS